MLVWSKSETGTIRQQQQDMIEVYEDHGLLIFADGDGRHGAELATMALKELSRELLQAKRDTQPQHGADKLRHLLAATHKTLQHQRLQYPDADWSELHVGVVQVIEGCLFAAVQGNVGILAGVGGQTHVLTPQHEVKIPVPNTETGCAAPRHGHGHDHEREQRLEGRLRDRFGDRLEGWLEREPESGNTHECATEPQIRILGPLPLQVGDWAMLVSQGILMSTPLEEIIPVMGALRDYGDDLPDVLFQRATARYDGDDRSMLLTRFLPGDLKRTMFNDLTLSEDYQREFSLPVWLVLTGAVLFSYLFFALSRWWRDR